MRESPPVYSRFIGALCWGAELANCVLNFFLIPQLWLSSGLKNPEQLLNSASYRRYGRWSQKIFGISVQQINPHDIDLSRQFILIANHSSWFDQPVMGLIPRRPAHFLAKAAYARFPILRQAMRLHQFVLVDPNDRERVVSEVRSILAKGNSLTLYPEGTRNNGQELIPNFKSGAFLFASGSGVPILPVYLQNTEKILVKGKPLTWVQRGVHVRVYIGQPITVAPGEEEPVKERIESKYLNMQKACRNPGHPPPEW